ncbi:MAG: hypothetical protein R3272_06815 [Candidatus Promineifilaceae bacterium]|nr:hypothetical protein [Candidatus Promineifilaceae bacterium]
MHSSLPFALLFLLLLLVACGGAEEGAEGGDLDIVGEDPAAQPGSAPFGALGEATLICSTECIVHGQCGQTEAREELVLLNREGPAVAAAEHDLTAPAGTTVSIIGTREQVLRRQLSGERLTLNFYQVSLPTLGETAWVASWCVDGAVP